MYKIELQWKEFKVSLVNLEKHLRENFQTYVGNQASSKLELFFSEEPLQEDKDYIADYWESLDGSDYVSESEVKQAIEALKAGLITKSWDQMSVAERKIVVGQIPTNEELGF